MKMKALACIAALVSPTTGIIDGHGYMLALQGDLEAHGGAVALATPVERLTPMLHGWRVYFGGRDTPTYAMPGPPREVRLTMTARF